jgi:hypothetical protein
LPGVARRCLAVGRNYLTEPIDRARLLSIVAPGRRPRGQSRNGFAGLPASRRNAQAAKNNAITSG